MNSTNLAEILKVEIFNAIESLPTQADFERGYFDTEVETMEGTKHTVRLGTIAPQLGEKLLRRYLATEDPRDLIRPMVAAEFASDMFLASLGKAELAKLVNRAAAMLIGPDQLRAILKLPPRIATNPIRENSCL